MLNVKQESCEYQLLKSSGVTRPGNRTEVYRLRGEPLTKEPRACLSELLLFYELKELNFSHPATLSDMSGFRRKKKNFTH